MKQKLLQKELVSACFYGDVPEVVLLLKRGANPNLKDSRGYSPIHMACQEGHAEIVDLLANNGGDLSAIDGNCGHPIFSVVGGGHLEVLRVLIRRGCDVNVRRSPGNTTPLLLVSSYGHMQVARLLIKAGANIEARDKRRRTPIFYAVMANDLAMVRLLINHGADLTKKCRNGHSVMEVAKKRPNNKIITLLAKALKK